MADATREVDDLMMPPDLSRLSGSSSSIFAASSGDFGSVAGGDPALVGADVGFGGIVEDTVVGVTSGTAGTSDTEPGDSSVSQGPKHASVYKHMYSNFPSIFFAQSHLNESYVFPQQVSVVPFVQLDPSSSHGALSAQVEVGEASNTAGAEPRDSYVSQGPGDSSVSQGPKHASVYMHIYSNFPLFVAQSHLSESYVFPQQVSVPSVQLDPSTSHGALTEQVEVRETTVGADSVSPSVSQIG
eukprot:CAMPEP_0201945042 /NCGR_PEP_ID=MMETSP0903-20130614/53704_1 /ASSEMBLY_ACC=CAM_ASM_000552 /TAXON_ID=420261 /ORGANISM="Thalassiosira antarctica, Strain CCMP982" /LENGTH=241 /DNA_ID=CAMNT_0048488101 /DNA_START=276 /DNA_END=1001 /DNA_ORIENTATION=-